MLKTHILVVGLVGLFASGCLAPAGVSLQRIHLPPGFHIELVANVPGARSMALSPSGTLFVGTRGHDVFAVVGRGDELKDPRVVTIAKGLDMPNGVAFRGGALYVAEVSRILRFDDIEKHLDDPPAPFVVNDRYPKDHAHGWKFIAFGPDGKLYVPIGAPCNICDKGDPYASITRIDPDGKNFEIVARGIRNSVGFDWRPGTNELWFTDNGRDWLGDDAPDDELDRISRAGEHFGYPYCHAGTISDPDYGKGHPCSEYVPPVVKLGAHVAALGMRFYAGSMFPASYRGKIFIAEHGSWNRSTKTGYRVVVVDPDRKTWAAFASGWLVGERAWGRPVDVLVMPDGSLLVSDDQAGAIYRIWYSSPVG